MMVQRAQQWLSLPIFLESGSCSVYKTRLLKKSQSEADILENSWNLCLEHKECAYSFLARKAGSVA